MLGAKRWHSRHFIFCCGILLLVAGCGLSEMFSGSNAEKITEPCIELIPSATPTPMPTVVSVLPITPQPSKTPTPSQSCRNAPGIVLICDGEPVEETPITVITPPPPVQTPQATQVIVNNTVSCEYWPSCGLAPDPPCCLIQDGISVAHDHSLKTVMVQAGSYNEEVTLIGPAITLNAGAGVAIYNPGTGSTFTIFSSGNVINGMTINGASSIGDSTIWVMEGGGITLHNSIIYATSFASPATCLYQDTGSTVNLRSNVFHDPFSTGGDAIACAGGTLTTNGNNVFNSTNTQRNTASCNPAIQCTSPLCSSPF